MRRGTAAAALPVALGCALVLAWGVSISELLRFAAYEFGLLLVPGVLLWWALSGERGVTLRAVCIGWALGHALEIGAFALTASTGARELLPAAIAASTCAALIAIVARKRTRRRTQDEEALPRRWALACVAVISVAIVYLAAAYFTQTPLPADVERVSYFQDYVFHLSVSGEALHHWPIGEPKVAGEPLPYHTFFYMHMAAVAQVTGIGLPVLLFRLAPVALLGAVVLQLAWAGRALTGRAWAGPLAALLLVAFGELDPDPDRALVFYNTFFYSLHTSPTFLLGLLLFTPALVLSAELSGAVPRAGARWGRWVALVLLLVACAGTKASILPVLSGGLVIFAAVRLALDRRMPGAPLAIAAAAAAIFAISYVGLYDGGEGGLHLDPPGSIAEMSPFVQLEPRFDGLPVLEQAFWLGATVVGLAGFCAAPLAGAAWMLRERVSRWPQSSVLLAAVFIASLFPFLLLSHPGGSQNFFTYYGYVAAAPLAAAGLISLLSCWRRRPGGTRRGAIAAVGGVVLALILGSQVESTSELRRDAVWFGIPALAILAASFVAPARLRIRVAAAATLAAVGVYGALDTPLDVAPDLTERARAGEPLYPNEGRGLTSDLYLGLQWLREETPDESVLAVSNYWVDDDQSAPFYSYYSAFAERRVFLEGWGLTVGTADAGPSQVAAGEAHPYPERLALNEAVFRQGAPKALARLRARGVDYLVVDLANGGAPGVARLGLGAPVFSNADIEIYAVPDTTHGRTSLGAARTSAG